ncbi:MAG: hypothetical protein IKT57_03805 [Clostridia bacterium]|nr:hypothetical protein [Clostridia bacterium]
MKKFVSLLVALMLCVSLFAPAMAEEAGNPDLSAAKSYLNLMYKSPKRGEPTTTAADYQVIGVFPVNGVEYVIEWTADSDTIKVEVGDDKMVTINVDETNPEEVFYKLTATIKDEAGNVETISFDRKVPASLNGLSYAQIVDQAYTVQDGETLDKVFRLYGTVTKIDTAWSADYKNITVTIAVEGKEDMPIMCYRLSGEGAENLQVGDAITVEGKFTNYKGTIEYAQGCQLIGYGEIISQQATLDAGYALLDGEKLATPAVLTGVVTKVDTAWSEEYKNITVTIVCDGKTEQPIMCYRLSGEGAAELAEGSEIAVVGTIKNYKGTIEFDAGCKLIPVEAVKDVRTLLNAYTVAEGESQAEACTLTGVISKIDTAWSEEYKNITVTIEVAGLTDYPFMCYRLAGEGAAELAVGDTITATGTVKNYKGTIEFDAGCTLDAVVKGAAEEAAAEEAVTEEVVEEVAAEPVTNHADYIAAELEVPVAIEMYVQDHQSWWDNKITVYAADQDGAYFIYEMACSEEDAQKLVPGTKIAVEGFKGAWAGEVEIMDATFTFVEGGDTYVAEPADVTELLGTEELINHQNEKVLFKGLEVVSITYKNDEPGDDIYVKVAKDGAEYDFCVERYLTGPETEVYAAVGALTAGNVIDVEGFLYWYEGVNTHITAVTVAE